MRQLNEHHSFTGMQRDMSISKHPTSFLYNAKNIRLTPRGDDTMFAITNERGTVEVGIKITGTYLGHCLLNNYLVVFTREASPSEGNPHDHITRIDLGAQPSNGANPNPKVLYSGELDFSTSYPIKAVASYENDQVQKVYWTDGYKPPRMINIVGDILDRTEGNEDTADSQFDFIRNLKLQETVKVKKIIGGNGAFPAGVIQYAFTYYQKHGQESNIFYTSPLIPVSPYDRGGKADEVVDNAFQISISGIDQSFDYLRIYSIQRTSLDGKPICKRVQDIAINPTGSSPISSTTFTDVGTSGDSVDPTELLFKGGESVVAKTIEQKDGTLFLGNLEVDRTNINPTIANSITIDNNVDRKFYPEKVTTGNYAYNCQLTALNASKDMSVPCAGFKKGDYYRLGVQFQYKTGKWSDPIFIKDEIVAKSPSIGTEDSGATPIVKVPVLTGTIQSEDVADLVSHGYKKVRAVVVYPSVLDRVTICQGVGCMAMNAGSIADSRKQASWFFRPSVYNDDFEGSRGTVSPFSNLYGHLPYMNVTYADGGLEYTSRYNPSDIRQVEIQGHFGGGKDIDLDLYFATINSPDIEFEDYFAHLALTTTSYRKVGLASFKRTSSNIEIQTETPTISTSATGAVSRAFDDEGSYGIVAGPFYEDWIVDDTNDMSFERWSEAKNPVLWMVYPWQRNGSLNNDIERPTGKGARSALLKKKVISNLRYADTIWSTGTITTSEFDDKPLLFGSDEATILKFGSILYQGNIDTLLSPSRAGGLYFGFGTKDSSDTTNADCPAIDTNNNVNTSFTSPYWWMTFIKEENGVFGNAGVYKWAEQENSNNNNELEWNWWFQKGAVGDKYQELALGKYPVRMKYKSTKHLVASSSSGGQLSTGSATSTNKSVLPIIEIIRKGDTPSGSAPFYRATMFGGTSTDAKKANLWIPCGEPVKLSDTDSEGRVTYEYSYGDTYFQRWECMKTYPFTEEDVNQIIEIGSFMLETHVNIDGRCDRNRGQLTNVSPRNFNLMNPVYSQLNNFFTYRILDSSYYSLNKYSNQITWTKEKIGGAEVDPWTNITLASTYDVDGSKGEIISLNTWKDKLFCFQSKGVSNILFNSRVQIPTSDNMPIEISNSYKVDGYRYLSDGIGCGNMFLIKETPSGIYFMDNVSNSLYHIGESIQDITTTHGMTSWFRNNASGIRKLLYDDVNHDLYLVCDSNSLCYSEVLGQFTSFLDYSGIPLIESYNNRVFTLHNNSLYGMFEGEYNDFFPTTALVEGQSVTTHNYQPWEFTFISNGSDNSTQDFDKIFSNIDYRMDISKGAIHKPDESLEYIQVVNEYQDTGKVALSRSRVASNYFNPQDANLQKKFRIWRIQIPRNKNSIDRIRNPWCKITLGSNGTGPKKAVLHDLNVQYYI